MSATIYTNSSTASKRLQLANGQALRRPLYLNNWTTIRIGLRLTIPSAANITGTPRLWVGVGSGLTNGIGDATTTNFVGIYTDTTTWTRATVAGPPVVAYSGLLVARSVKKVATTVTQNAASYGSNLLFSLQDTFLGMLMVEITKGSPNYSINIAMPTSSSAFNGDPLPGVTEAQMDQFMSTPIGFTGITAVKNVNYNTPGAQTLAMSEAAGNLDCIQIYWDKTAANCEIESVYHKKMA